MTLYRYSMATLGWKGLNFFGHGGGLVVDSARSDADRKTVLEYLSIPEEDMLEFNLGAQILYRPNYFICIDRKLSAVVLAIRGTMSLRDTITDLVCEYVPWKDGMVHSGMIEAARYFQEGPVQRMIQWAREHKLSNIYLIGHSLGGGTATLTTMLLLEHLWETPDAWPRQGFDNSLCGIHCYTWGTPSVVSPNLVSRYAPFIDSFVYGDDVVPRLCFGSVADLRLLLIKAAQLVQGWHMFRPPAPDSPILAELARCRSIIQSQAQNPKMTPPGKLHHFVSLPAPSNQKFPILETLERPGERFWELELRPQMIAHHMPNRYYDAFMEVYQNLPE